MNLGPTSRYSYKTRESDILNRGYFSRAVGAAGSSTLHSFGWHSFLWAKNLPNSSGIRVIGRDLACLPLSLEASLISCGHGLGCLR